MSSHCLTVSLVITNGYFEVKHFLHVLFKLIRGMWSQHPRLDIQYKLVVTVFLSVCLHVGETQWLIMLVKRSIEATHCWQVNIAFHKFYFKVAMSAVLEICQKNLCATRASNF